MPRLVLAMLCNPDDGGILKICVLLEHALVTTEVTKGLLCLSSKQVGPYQTGNVNSFFTVTPAGKYSGISGSAFKADFLCQLVLSM
jgi:hypothetical protein